MWLFGRLIDRLFGCSIDWSLAGCMYSVYIVAHNVVRPVVDRNVRLKLQT